MSLKEVRVFYEVLTVNEAIYKQYFNLCGRQGFFGSWHWDKTKIVKFAASLGFHFNEGELEYSWFESNPSSPQASLNSLEEQPTYLEYEQDNTKYPAAIGAS
jgi:hypothetical protein